jgi:nicotinamide mononucleotide transporter
LEFEQLDGRNFIKLKMTTEKILEIFAVATGFLAVWLNVKEKIWAWPLGLLSVAAAAYVYFQTQLFAEFYLHIFYAGTNVYGWYSWYMLAGKSLTKKAPVKRMSSILWFASLTSGCILSIAIAQLMLYLHNPDLVWIDSSIAGYSIIGQILLSRKYLENWLFWIVIDVVCIGVYLHKGLEYFALLYVAFLGLSVMGILSWQKSKNESAYN